MTLVVISPLEEESLAFLAVEKLGACTAHDVTLELGVENIRHTLGRLVAQGRVSRRRSTSRSTPAAQVWVYERVTVR